MAIKWSNDLLRILRRLGVGFVFGAIFFSLTGIAHAADAARARYTLAIVPYQLPLTAHKDWIPVAKYLSERVGADIELRVYRSFPSFETELFQGVPDFAFINPYHQVMAHRRHGYIPLVRSNENLQGILVVPRDAPVRSVKDLEGKAIVFPSPNAFAASLYLRAILTEREKIRFTPVYLDSHNEVYHHVALGQAAAGGGVRGTLTQESPRVQEQVRVLFETPAMVSHPLTAHPRVPVNIRAAVAKALLDLGMQPNGKQMLERIQLDSPVAADQKRDYQPLEQLHLEKYVALPQQ